MKNIGFCLLLLLFTGWVSCKEEKHHPLVKGAVPGPVKDYTVRNLPGAAEITYTIPDNKVSYIMAEYETKEGVKREARSSKYGNVLRVEGYPAAGDYDVTLFAVGRDDRRSEPLVVGVSPLRPPVLTSYDALKVTPDFGGVRVNTENETHSNLVVNVITTDSLNEWYLADQYFTSVDDINFSVRGFDAEPRQFGVFVRDQWLNYSDTFFAEITPYFEEQIDMSNFYETNLPGDQWENHQVGSSRSISRLFDGRKGSQSYAYYSVLNTGMPQHFTIYLQGVYQLSRLKWWQNVGTAYGSSNPKRFRIWGSVNPNPNGDMDSTWTLLGEFQNIKPSGLPLGETNADDVAQAEAGDEVSFDAGLPAVSYIRFETLETWAQNQQVYITEMEIWGSKH